MWIGFIWLRTGPKGSSLFPTQNNQPQHVCIRLENNYYVKGHIEEHDSASITKYQINFPICTPQSYTRARGMSSVEREINEIIARIIEHTGVQKSSKYIHILKGNKKYKH
jgi:hypothetical protein